MNYNIILKDIRIDNKLSQEQVANILGITRTVYNKYENGYEIIPIKYLITLANYFNSSIDYLLGFSMNKNIQCKSINNKIIEQRLKKFRKEHKLTQEKLATILNTNKSVICNYERGRYLIATPFLYTICKKYHISADYLLGRIDEPKYFN